MAAHDASASIELLESLLNTADRYNGVDELGDATGAAARLRSLGLLDSRDDLDAAGLQTIRTVRDCLRRLAAATTRKEAPGADDVRQLTDLLAPGHLRLEMVAADDLTAALRPPAAGRALPAALGTIAAAVYDLVHAQAWTRFKACANEDCQWAFYDRSRSRTGRWCDMRACGNLVKARAYRRRRTAASGSSEG